MVSSTVLYGICGYILHRRQQRLQNNAPVRKSRYEYTPGRFQLDQWSDDKCMANFRFNKADIRRLIDQLGLHGLKHSKRYATDPEFSLCLVLYRLSFPSRLNRLQDVFGMHTSSLSTIFNETVLWIAHTNREILLWHPLLTTERIHEYAKAIGDQFNTDGLIWGWIDGTFKQFCRPEIDQRFWYSGYKKSHGLKYQAIVTPDGLVLSIAGPYEGKINDVTMVRESGLEERLEHLLDQGSTEPVYLYGDEAYRSFHYIIAPWPGGRIAPGNYRERNRQLSSLRISVENLFGINQTTWSSNAFRIGLRSGQMPLASIVETAFLLTNCRTCIYGNQVSRRFGIEPLSLEDYLNNP